MTVEEIRSGTESHGTGKDLGFKIYTLVLLLLLL